MTRLHQLSLLLPLAAALAACDGDPARPAEVRQTSELTFLEPEPGATLATVASFWAVRGDNRELRLRFAPLAGGGDSVEFLRFEVDNEALLRRPDGTLFAENDSILITVRVIDASRLILEFLPSGLRFNPSHPAELRLHLERVDDDIDDDGDVDSRDDDLLRQDVSLWRQESDGQPWRRVGTAYVESLDEFEADITGFTNYALAF